MDENKDTPKAKALAKLDKLSEQVEKVRIQLAGWAGIAACLDGARAPIGSAIEVAKSYPDDAKPGRRPAGAHVVAGRIYEIKDKARKNYATLGADVSACLIEYVGEGDARALLSDADGREIRAVVKLAHLGKEVK